MPSSRGVGRWAVLVLATLCLSLEALGENAPGCRHEGAIPACRVQRAASVGSAGAASGCRHLAHRPLLFRAPPAGAPTPDCTAATLGSDGSCPAACRSKGLPLSFQRCKACALSDPYASATMQQHLSCSQCKAGYRRVELDSYQIVRAVLPTLCTARDELQQPPRACRFPPAAAPLPPAGVLDVKGAAVRHFCAAAAGQLQQPGWPLRLVWRWHRARVRSKPGQLPVRRRAATLNQSSQEPLLSSERLCVLHHLSPPTQACDNLPTHAEGFYSAKRVCRRCSQLGCPGRCRKDVGCVACPPGESWAVGCARGTNRRQLQYGVGPLRSAAGAVLQGQCCCVASPRRAPAAGLGRRRRTTWAASRRCCRAFAQKYPAWAALARPATTRAAQLAPRARSCGV